MHADLSTARSLTFGEHAHSIVAEHYQAILKRERKVLRDEDPEPLHEMRVATRRLRVALALFAPALSLPLVLRSNFLGSFSQKLGKLRDLDVQIADLRTAFQPFLDPTDQESLETVLLDLAKQRQRRFHKTERLLHSPRYQSWKASMEAWLKHPQYHQQAQHPLMLLLPDLLSLTIAQTLLHPAWWIPGQAIGVSHNALLHDLRKQCKQARYQGEFLASFYGQAFDAWVLEMKGLQEDLGLLHDSQVLQQMLLKKRYRLSPACQSILHQRQSQALHHWDPIRQRYIDEGFRRALYELVRQPLGQGDSDPPPNFPQDLAFTTASSLHIQNHQKDGGNQNHKDGSEDP